MADDRTPDERDAIRSTYAAYDQGRRDRLWDRTNRGFDRLKSDTEARLLGLLRSCVIEGKSRVLDVGCGTGDLAVLARADGIGAPWTGIDLLPDRINQAASRVPDATFIVGSADAMPFDDGAFDVVSAITLFSSIPSPAMEDAAAREIGRVLAPGGWLIWYDLRYDNPSNAAVHGISSGRLGALFPGWRAEVRSFTLAPPIARRLGRLTPVAYPILHAIPPVRSHLIGRLRAPE